MDAFDIKPIDAIPIINEHKEWIARKLQVTSIEISELEKESDPQMPVVIAKFH